MSRTMNWILKQQENGNDLLEMQKYMDELTGNWEFQDSDPNAEKEAEKLLSDDDFYKSLERQNMPF